MDRMKKLLQYAPLLIPIIFILVIVWILLIYIPKSYGATINYECNYLGCISQIDMPTKNLRIVLLDLRSVIVEPFGSYIVNNNIPIKNYAIAGVRLSTGVVLKLFTFDTLAQVKQKAMQYAQTHNITLKFKEHLAGQSIKDWWGQTEIQ